MNRDNGAFQRGIYSGDWSQWNSIQSENRFAYMSGGAGGRSPAWLIGGILGMFLGALGGAKAGGFLAILSGSAVGALAFAALFSMPGLIWKAAAFTVGRTLKIFRHEKI